MALQTRKPTGKPAWPILLLAGREGAGKTWAAIEASASQLVGRTIYLGFGEDDPDEYGLIEGANFDIAVHDGTYQGLLDATRDAVSEPPAGDKPTLLILDSGTRLWNVIGDNMQAIANRRANGRRNQASGDYTISTDLWNVAAAQWQDVMDALREHRGPVIVTARLDPVTVMENGQPTKEKEWKVQAHKSLVFDASAVVEMRERGQAILTKVKSVRHPLDKPRPLTSFTVDTFWGQLGLADGTGERSHSTVVADRSGAEPARRGQPEPTNADEAAPAAPAGVDPAAVAAWLEWKETIDSAPDRGALKDLVEKNGLGALLQREIPGDPKGRKVSDYLNHVWSQLPESTPEAVTADPGSGEVTEWKAAEIPADQPAEAVSDDEVPF